MPFATDCVDGVTPIVKSGAGAPTVNAATPFGVPSPVGPSKPPVAVQR